MTYKVEDFTKAIENSGGFISTIARRIGCDRTTVYRAIEKYATVKQAIADEKENMKDMAEGELLKQIKGGNTTAVIFYLKTQGKDRGYVERQEQHIDITSVKDMTDDELRAIINSGG